jgi:DNA-binding NarL/FixJ family response regulator
MSHTSDVEAGTWPGRAQIPPQASGQPGRLLPRGVVRPPASARPAPARPHAIPPLTTLVGVLLCEDREVFRLGLRVVLEAEPDMAVVAETTHLPEALEALEATDGGGTQVVVVRQGLIGGAALPLLRALCQRKTAVLVLAEPEAETGSGLLEILQAGVRGYLPRRSAAQRFVDAVRALARHEAALDSTATSHLVRHLTDLEARPAPAVRALDRLTDRQREVAELVAQGLNNEEIARRLFLSLATVKSHLTASMRRLDVRTRTQLAIAINRNRSPAA